MKDLKNDNTDRIHDVLTNRIKNIKPEKYQECFNILSYDQEFLGVKILDHMVKEILDLSSEKSGIGRKNYWIKRGWTELEARVKISQYKKTRDKKRVSPFSVEFWLTKINPDTGFIYTLEEAELERNSKRPIRKEYWIKQGFNEQEAIAKAIQVKNSNNKKGSLQASKRPKEEIRAFQHSSIDYWILRGYDIEEAKDIISKNQTTFSLEICLERYGEIEGYKVWTERQIKWKESLKASGLHSGFSKISNELFLELNLVSGDLMFSENEYIVKTDYFVYNVDCFRLGNNKIIEFFGDYWHANPDRFGENDLIKARSAKDIWYKDSIKINNLEELGYDVLIIWESDYRKDKKGIINKCMNFLN